MGLFKNFFQKKDEDESSGDECEDKSADDLSYVGMAAYEVLRKHHNHHHHELWNVTKGKVIGDVMQTPRDAWTRIDTVDPEDGHDDWFPEKLGEILSRTEEWCDVLSLGPPDGLFMDAFKKALLNICLRRENQLSEGLSLGDQRITIRMMFGNIVGMPVNCTSIIKQLTKDLPPVAQKTFKLWVGSWRKGVSWNHAKIIAVDGKHLWTGGHNFWDYHYCKCDPVYDLSIELEGSGVTNDAHRYANAQWGYIIKKQSTAWGKFVDQYINDSIDVPRRARVTVSEYPPKEKKIRGADGAEFPPRYVPKRKLISRRDVRTHDDAYVPMITMGRYGVLLKKARPSDDAIVAMIDSARTIIRMSLQDLGPVAIPGTKYALPGCEWPKAYLEAMGRVMWTKQVDVEIVLSNPNSIPGNLSATEANYGNGWSCVDVAAEIIKTIKKQFPDADDKVLRVIVEDNLRICFIRCPRGGNFYNDGQSLGLHSKHFIIDDQTCYIGSQNLYICDLAEWGVVIDNREQVQKIKNDYWDKMWSVSHMANNDVNVEDVMDGLNIDRGTPSAFQMTQIQLNNAKQQFHPTGGAMMHTNMINDDEEDKNEPLSDGED